MLSLLVKGVKLALYVTVVLILGNLIEWKGKTLSDQVRSSMGHASKSETVNTAKVKVNQWIQSIDSQMTETVTKTTREARARANRKANEILEAEKKELQEIFKVQR